MRVKFFPGFSVFDGGDGPAWVAPHAGPGFKFSDSRDDKTDVIAGLCCNKIGGKAIVSNASRIRDFGVDFNRAPPSQKDSFRMNSILKSGRIDQEAYYKYKRQYAWVAEDEDDHRQRLKLYRSFWREVGKSDTAVLIHTMYVTPKTCKSLIDIFSSGIDENVLKSSVEKVNRKYAAFFGKIKKDFTDYMVHNEKRSIEFVRRAPKGKVEKEFTYDLNTHMKIVGAKSVDGILPGIENYMKKVFPKVTIRQVFTGDKSHGLKNLSGDTKIIQTEVSIFLSQWYPDMASDIICEIVRGVI